MPSIILKDMFKINNINNQIIIKDKINRDRTKALLINSLKKIKTNFNMIKISIDKFNLYDVLYFSILNCYHANL